LAAIVCAFSILPIINDKTCYQVRALVAIVAGRHDGGQLVSVGFWWEQTHHHVAIAAKELAAIFIRVLNY